MWQKLIITLVLVALAGADSGNSLSCYSCNTPTSCRQPSLQTCNNEIAQLNGQWLTGIFQNVAEIRDSSNFGCVGLKYVSHEDNLNQEFKGCLYRDIDACALSTQPDKANITECNTCEDNICNPAGTYSSSIHTIIISALTLVFAKLICS